MFAAESRGEVPKGTARRWAHETPNIKRLPDKKHKKHAALMNGFLDEIIKLAKERREHGRASGLMGAVLQASQRVGRKHGDPDLLNKVREVMRNVREPSSN